MIALVKPSQVKPVKAKNPENTVNCPTCHGKGERDASSLARPGQKQLCLACRGTGQVHPDRVCAKCGEWAVNCQCKASLHEQHFKLPAQEPAQELDTPDTPDRPRGVSWNKATGKYIAWIYRKPKQYYMGYWEDLKTAIAIRLEADNLPVEEFSALRARYRAMRDGKPAQPLAQPVETGSSPLVSRDLLAAYEAARQADERYCQAQDAYDQAATELPEAKAQAFKAWQHVLTLLGQLAGPASLLDEVLARSAQHIEGQ